MDEKDIHACIGDMLLSATSGYIVIHLMSYDDEPIMYCTYSYLLFHGVIGIMQHANVKFLGKLVEDLHNTSELNCYLTPLGLFTADFYLKHGYNKFIAHIHEGAAIVTAGGCGIVRKDVDIKWFDRVVIGNACSLGICGLINKKYLVTAVAAIYAGLYFGSRKICDRYDLDGHSAEPLALSVFCVLSYLTLIK